MAGCAGASPSQSVPSGSASHCVMTPLSAAIITIQMSPSGQSMAPSQPIEVGSVFTIDAPDATYDEPVSSSADVLCILMTTPTSTTYLALKAGDTFITSTLLAAESCLKCAQLFTGFSVHIHTA